VSDFSTNFRNPELYKIQPIGWNILIGAHSAAIAKQEIVTCRRSDAFFTQNP
jgi:hypothetical protein